MKKDKDNNPAPISEAFCTSPDSILLNLTLQDLIEVSGPIPTEQVDAELDRLGVFKSYKDKLFDLLQGLEDKDCTLSNIELHNQLGIAQRTIRQHLAELEAEGKISRSYPKPNKRVIKVLK